MECGIETRHLWQIGCRSGHGADRGEVMWLMMGSQRRQLLEFLQELSGDQRRTAAIGAAMDDAVTGTDQPQSAGMIRNPVQGLGNRLPMIANLTGLDRLCRRPISRVH